MMHPKAALIERLQREGRGQPQFDTERSGPDHEPLFRAVARVQGVVVGEGQGGNKREAERRAAEAALARLDRDARRDAERAAQAAAQAETERIAAERLAAERAEAERLEAARREAEREGRVAATPAAAALPFSGPWPLLEGLLTETLRIAHARVDADLRGDAALQGIESFALRLYKDVLEDLGEVVEADG
jgi:hypothetical protein